MPTPLDILIVGAGLSGIGAGYHVQTQCPRHQYAILEARESMGGTWDLFRYPGVRSDSDMYTLGYPFFPWEEGKAIADGPSILNYIQRTATHFGIDQHIRYLHRVKEARWSTDEARWTLEVETGAGREQFTCRYLYLCAGYYDYAAGYLPEFKGRERFRGRIVHPQQWPSDLDYHRKKVVVIGSGATAVTLVPEMARTAAHVTMLQRTPTYIARLPSEDKLAHRLRRLLPASTAHHLVRWKNVLHSMVFYQLARRAPSLTKWLLQYGVKKGVGPDCDLKHFTPPYNPWDQRLCVVPDGDLFETVKRKRASIVTDHIESFTETGIALKSGQHLEADVIVTATGLKLQLMGGMRLFVDNCEVQLSDCRVYKGMMLSNVPNLAFAVGYTNASWTLKADLSSRYFCRLIKYMEQRGYSQGMPRVKGDLRNEPLMDFTSGYVQRDLATLPRQGHRKPWKLYQNYLLDLMTLGYRSVSDNMEFTRKG
jgi:monooxygenase